MNLILLICLIIVRFQCTLCNETITRYSDSESIKVQLPRYEEEVLSCTLVVRFLSSKPLESVLLYDKESSFFNDDMFKYVGKDDNTCSFEIYPNKWPSYFLYKNGSPLTQEWTVYERHVTDGSWYKTLKSWLGASNPDERKFDFYLSPQTFYERTLMAMSGHRITRKAPYTNKTISILTQPKKHLIHKCTLFIPLDTLFGRSREIVLYDMHSSVSLSAESGFEFIGVDDNSCSFRIIIDTLERKDEKYVNTDWIIQEYYGLKDSARARKSGSSSIFNFYEFFMPSIFWWQGNMKSKLFLCNGALERTIKEYL